MTKLHTKNRMASRRGVAPVIATLLLVAIAVVGGSIVFVFSQGFFSSAQISGSPNIESIKILGYDATDGNATQFHDGFVLNSTTVETGAEQSDGLRAGEYIAVYLKNDSVNKVTFSEIRLAGEIYNYVDKGASPLATYTTDLKTTDVAEYTIVEEGFVDNSNMAITLDSSSPSLEPGQQATMMLQLESDVKSGRDLQFKLTTSSGAVFVGTIQSGQQSG